MTNVLNKSMLKRMLCFLLIVLLCFMWCGEVYRAYAIAPVIYFVLTMILSCGITFGASVAALTAAEEFCNFLQGKDATLYSSLMGGTEVAKENGKWVVSNAFAGKLATIIYYIYEFFSGNSIICTTDISSKGSTANIGEYSIKSIGNYLNYDDTSYMLDRPYYLKYHRGVWYFPISTFENTPKFLEFKPIVVNMKSGDSYTFSCLPGYNANYQPSYILKITYSDGSSFGSHSGKEGLTVTSSHCCEPVIVAKGGVLYFTFAIISGCIYYDESSTVNDAWRLCILDYDYGDASRYYIPLDDIADVQIESETIDVYHERGALDEETVANAWKAYGDARIAREEAVTISDAVVSDALSNDTVLSLTQSEVLTDTGVIEGVDTVDTPILDDYQVSTDLDGMKVELKDIFPFCVPFDVFDIVKNLQAGREAPSFSYEFKFDKIGLDYTFNINLSEFDTVAAILRTMELIAFCVGLALITRQIIRS